MRKKSTYIILIIVLLLFAAIMFFLFGGVERVHKSRSETTLVVGEKTVWSFYDKKWHYLSSTSSIEKYNWKAFNVFINNQNIGKYYLWHDDKWYAFDSKKSAVKIDGELLAYRSNEKIKVSSFQESEVEDDSYFEQVLAKSNLNLSNDYTSKFMIRFDYDGDGVEEEFYVISNVFALDFQPETNYSIVFMVKDDKIYSIYNDITSNQSFNGCKPYFHSFLDVDQDNEYEFILSCGYYANSKRADMLYKFVDGEFKILISNQ